MLVQLIVENVVTCFLRHSVDKLYIGPTYPSLSTAVLRDINFA